MAESPSQSAAQLVAHQSPGHEAESDLSSLVFGLFFSLLLLIVFTLSSDLGISLSYSVQILCNDCGKKSEVQYHVVAQKCPNCKSYNTRQTRG